MTELDTGTQDLLARVEDGVGVITFNRPERRNALSDAMYHGFRQVLPEMASNPDVRVVMLTGAQGAFCAGGDVKRMHDGHEATSTGSAAEENYDERISYLRQRHQWVSESLYDLPKPVVAALPGAAAGAGLSMALAADLRIAAERAVLVTAFATIGASGDFGGSWFLTQLVGVAKAKELYFTSPRLTAADAAELGIVNTVLPDEGFEEAAMDYCRAMAQRAPIAMRYMKENLNRATHATLRTALDAEAVNMVRTMSTTDHKEAAAAFTEKRPPEFHGH